MTANARPSLRKPLRVPVIMTRRSEQSRLHERGGSDGYAPALKGVDGLIVDLTARETEIVDLARGGLSKAEIAEQLVLSVRTIESPAAALLRCMSLPSLRCCGRVVELGEVAVERAGLTAEQEPDRTRPGIVDGVRHAH